jgi:hypothetical protein
MLPGNPSGTFLIRNAGGESFDSCVIWTQVFLLNNYLLLCSIVVGSCQVYFSVAAESIIQNFH